MLSQLARAPGAMRGKGFIRARITCRLRRALDRSVKLLPSNVSNQARNRARSEDRLFRWPFQCLRPVGS